MKGNQPADPEASSQHRNFIEGAPRYKLRLFGA